MSKIHQSRKESSKPIIAQAQLDRRRLLIGLSRGLLLAATALVIDQVVRFLSFEPPRANSSVIPIGQPKDYPKDTLTYVETARAYVGHDEKGLYALDAVCTHLGCLVEKGKKDGFKCPCHGSRFDGAGRPKTGPATKPLQYLSLWLDETGQLMIDRAQSVEPALRLTF